MDNERQEKRFSVPRRLGSSRKAVSMTMGDWQYQFVDVVVNGTRKAKLVRKCEHQMSASIWYLP